MAKDMTNRIMDSICDSISDNTAIVDVGFGNTILAETIFSQKKGCTYIGVDTNSKTVEAATKEYADNQQARFFLGEIDSLPSLKADIIVWSRIFHHLDLAQARKQFDSMRNILKDNGKIIIVDSIRDYCGRENRYSYTPIFFINEMSRAFETERNRIVYSDRNNISVNQFWKLVITKGQEEFYTEIKTI